MSGTGVPETEHIRSQTYRVPKVEGVELAVQTLSMTWGQSIERANQGIRSAAKVFPNYPVMVELTAQDTVEVLMARIFQLDLELRMLLANVGYVSPAGTEIPLPDLYSLFEMKREKP